MQEETVRVRGGICKRCRRGVAVKKGAGFQDTTPCPFCGAPIQMETLIGDALPDPEEKA